MNLGEILDRTVQIYRARFLALIAIAAVSLLAKIATGILGLIAAQSTLSTPTKAALGQVASWLPGDWPALFVSCLVWPIFVQYAGHIYLNDEIPIGSAIRSCDARCRSWFALTGILWSAWYLFPSLLRHLFLVLGGRPAYRASGLFDVLAEPLLRCFMILCIAFSVPAWVVEELGVVPALRRSARFIRGNWLRVFTAWLMSSAIWGTLFFVFGTVLTLAFRAVPTHFSYSGRFYEIRGEAFGYASWISSILTASLVPIALTLFYYDQRIRHEGYDIERMMDAAGLNTPPTPPAAEAPSAPGEAAEGQA
jgi:hypothetical protein